MKRFVTLTPLTVFGGNQKALHKKSVLFQTGYQNVLDFGPDTIWSFLSVIIDGHDMSFSGFLVDFYLSVCFLQVDQIIAPRYLFKSGLYANRGCELVGQLPIISHIPDYL